MNILIISVESKIPVVNYGGTERIVWCLAKELSKLGHKVSLLIAKGSKCDFAEVIEYDINRSINEQIPAEIQLIHTHTVTYDLPEHIPNLFTLHGNVTSDFVPLNNTVCISRNHAERCHLKTFVYNGLDWDSYGTIDLNKSRNYLHFLGKAKWKVKNFKDATKIAVKSKNELRVLGGTKWNYENLKRGTYYKLHPLITYHGMVNDKEKIQIMQQSKGLLFPVKWHEPFGLAIIESMFAGCPVFGSNFGSLPELITSDVGVTSDSVDELVEAVKSNDFKPKICHEYALENFNSKVMTVNYVKLYDKVLQGVNFNLM